MKHMRKALSLFLALAMIICFAVPAFAADTDTATVTVYVTTGMFTPGGYDPDHGTFLEQEFRNQVERLCLTLRRMSVAPQP